jgi:hypothetical protein
MGWARSATIIISLVNICFVTRKKQYGAKIDRRVDNGSQVNRIAELAMKRKPSVYFSGYWQRH